MVPLSFNAFFISAGQGLRMTEPKRLFANPTVFGPPGLGSSERGMPAWRFAILARLTNYPVLRRHLGRPRAETLIDLLSTHIEALLPEAIIIAGGFDRIEIGFDGSACGDLDQALVAVDAAFEAAFDIDGERCRLDLALGGAATPAPHYDEVRLIEVAEQALSEAEGNRRPVARLVEAVVGRIDALTLSRDLHLAIDRDELFVQYQPKLHLRRQSICSLEALIRWRHPTRGLILPGDFIPVAEQSSDIGAMTLWTIRRVISDQRLLAARGHDLRIFVNIAGVLLCDPKFVRNACLLVEQSGAVLGFEVTETSVIRDPSIAIAHLKQLAGIGITVAIDDYGAGLSSLAYLKQLPARELKIDKLFVTQLTSSNRDPLIVRSTIDLAHAMEMEVVAEGVETQAALALLTVMGCDMAQGFLISRPICFDALVTYLDEERHLALPQNPRAMFGRQTQAWKRA